MKGKSIKEGHSLKVGMLGVVEFMQVFVLHAMLQ